MGLLDKYSAPAAPAANHAPIAGADLDKLLNGIEDREPGESYSYFRPGPGGATAIYVVELVKFSRVDTRKNETMLAVECLVHEAINHAPECPVGSKQSWTQKLVGVDLEQAQKNIMGFLLAVMNPQTEDERRIIKANAREILKDAYGAEQPLRGRRFVVECKHYVPKKGPNQGKSSSICNFRPAPTT